MHFTVFYDDAGHLVTFHIKSYGGISSVFMLFVSNRSVLPPLASLPPVYALCLCVGGLRARDLYFSPFCSVSSLYMDFINCALMRCGHLLALSASSDLI